MNKARLYSDHHDLQRVEAMTVINEFAEHLAQSCQESAFLLDIGSGPGDVLVNLILPKLSEKISKVIGTDLSEKMVTYANNNYADDFINFHQLDISEASSACKKLFGQTKFDIITSFNCFHWIQDQRQAFTNIYSLLKPTGTVLLQFIATCPIFDIYESLSKVEQYQPYMSDCNSFISPYHHARDPKEFFKKIIYAAGFKATQVEIRDRHFVYKNKTQWLNAVRAVNPFTPRMPDDLQEQFMDDYCHIVEQITENKHIEPHTEIIARYQIIVAVLTK